MPATPPIASLIALLLAPTTIALGQNVLSGRILADDTRRSLTGAEVLIGALNLRTVSDADGSYRLSGLPTGHHAIQIRRIGYQAANLSLGLEAADTMEVDVILLPVPFELPTLTAEAARVRSARLAAFEHRRRMGFGRFIAEDDLKAREGSSLADILRMRGVNVAVHPDKFLAVPMARGENIEGKTSYCTMHMLVDGVEVPVDNVNLNTNAIQHYAAIEIYQRLAAIPIEYTATGFSCGAIFLWTKP